MIFDCRQDFEVSSQLEFDSKSVLIENVIAKSVTRLSKAERGIALVAAAVSRQKELLRDKERIVKDKEESLRIMEKRLADEVCGCVIK